MALLFDLSDRSKLRFSGPQALWFLDQLVTNQVVELQPGSGRPALLLTPKGRITAVLRVLATEHGALVDLEAADPQSVFEFFTNRIFATKVKIDDVTDDFALLRLAGPGPAQSGPPPLELESMPALPNSMVERDFGYAVTLDEPLHGFDLWVRREAKDYIFETFSQSGIHPGSESEYEAYRVTKGAPKFGVDFDSSYLPQEAALERAVHFKKGCYLGQEAVAMAQRGRIKRRVRHLELSGPAAPGELWHDDALAGSITSAAGSFGIGTVKTVVEPGAEVSIRSGAAEVGTARVLVLPGTVEGPSVPSARELRERLQRGS